jgi:hypothetical protein
MAVLTGVVPVIAVLPRKVPDRLLRLLDELPWTRLPAYDHRLSRSILPSWSAVSSCEPASRAPQTPGVRIGRTRAGTAYARIGATHIRTAHAHTGTGGFTFDSAPGVG